MFALLLFLAAWLPQSPVTKASLRGVKALPDGTVWASGTQGTYLRSIDGGRAWKAGVVPGAEALDFRAVEAFDANRAWLMSAGEGAKSRLYATADGGRDWQLQFANPDAKGFWDCLRFWDARHGILLGDPVGGRFTIFTTNDAGATWRRQSPPPSVPEEGAFTASNTSLAVYGRSEVWFGTGGPSGARVFHSKDRGKTWSVSATPMAGIFSMVFLNPRYGVAVGGDYVKPNDSARNIAITTDGGSTWSKPELRPAGYRSSVAYHAAEKLLIAVGTNGSDVSSAYGRSDPEGS